MLTKFLKELFLKKKSVENFILKSDEKSIFFITYCSKNFRMVLIHLNPNFMYFSRVFVLYG